VAINFLRGEQRVVSAIESTLKGSDNVGITTVSVFEILQRIHHRKLQRHEKTVRGFFGQLRTLELDSEGAEEAAKMRGALLRIGRQVNALDVLIAGTAAANAAEKVLSTDRDYEQIAKVSDLEVEILK